MWQEEYKRKLTSSDAAIQMIKSNSNLCLGFGPTTISKDIIEQILKRGDELNNVCILDATQLHNCNLYNPEYMSTLDGKINHISGYNNLIARKIAAANESDFYPMSSFDCSDKAANRADIFMVMVTPPDSHGYVNYGISNFWNKEIVEGVRKKGGIVIGEVNENMPIIFGDNYDHISKFNYFYEKMSPLPQFIRDTVATADEKAIGNFALELLKDGDTIQMGIGGITEAVLEGIEGIRDLGIFTEMMPQSLPSLMEKGIVTNLQKPLNTGKSICCLILGDQKLYDFCTENPSVEVHSSTYTNDPRIISQHPNMVAMNNALMIDFNGQVVADSAGFRHISGPGGQCDFAIGAYWSQGGRGITMLRAARKNKDGMLVSNIVPGLPEGTSVTVPRVYVDYIITEFGIAHLRYKTRRERALELISIAHPDLRSELKKTLMTVFYPKRYHNK